jgi:predicted nucleotidyltransferase
MSSPGSGDGALVNGARFTIVRTAMAPERPEDAECAPPAPLRAIGADFDSAAVAAIDARLRSLVARERVAILLAIESGSRAWGFPSPDSDYDCRFIFSRRRDDYLALFPPRDVIECPPDPVLDVNGWDLAKALRLMLKGNAVVIEWLTSPFAYAGDARFRAEALALARTAAAPAAIARHYLHLGERQRRTCFADTHAVPLKKLFYALRPAVALRWLRLHPGEAVAPMHFPTLAAGSDLPPAVAAIVADLLARKAVTRELGSGALPPPVGALIDAEFALARELWPREPWRPAPATVDAANALFRRWAPAWPITEN